MPDRNKELERALDRGERDKLPPNVPPGMLGEQGLDLRKADEFKPSLNAGITQESTPETRLLTIVLLYVLVFTSPVAAWMLWRSPTRPLWAKIIITIIGAAFYVLVWVYTLHGPVLH